MATNHNERERRAQRRAARDEDPIGYASIQSAEEGRAVLLPFSREALERYGALRCERETIAAQRDAGTGEVCRLAQVEFRGRWESGLPWCVRVCDVPAELEGGA